MISRGRIDEDPDNGREIQQGDKDWHPILTWIGVVTGWAVVKHKQGMGRNLENKNYTMAHGDCGGVPVIQRGNAMRQQVQGEEVFPDEAQSRDCMKSCVQQEVSCALNEDNRQKAFQCMQGWKDELLQRHLIEGVQMPVLKGDRLWWKAKTPKRVGVGGAVKRDDKRHRSSRHRKWDGRLRGVYRNLLFLCNQWQWSHS